VILQRFAAKITSERLQVKTRCAAIFALHLTSTVL